VGTTGPGAGPAEVTGDDGKAVTTASAAGGPMRLWQGRPAYGSALARGRVEQRHRRRSRHGASFPQRCVVC